jgi:hypothetical protein
MALVGTCSSPLKWDASSDDDLVVSPSSGTSQLTVTVTTDESSVRFTPGAAGVGPSFCKAKLSVDAAVHLETDDGTFVADGTATVEYDGTNFTSLNFRVPLEQLRGTLSIHPKTPGTNVALSFDVGPIGKGCAGEIRLETAAALPGGHGGVGASGTFGSWSSTGCAVGETAVDLNAPEPSVATAVASAWKTVSYEGTWDDGTMTQLKASVGSLPPSGCKDGFSGGEVQFDASITYETADGRLKSHSVPTHVRTLGDAAPWNAFSLDTTEEFACDSPSSELPYTPDGCDSFSRVVLQLGMGYDKHPGSTNGGRLTVYEYGKHADPSTGASDSQRTLVFGTN